MYKRILLASDGAPESLVALREGALMAEALGAAVFLLIVEGESAGALFANAVHPGFHRDAQPLLDLLALGLDRLKQLGVEARGEVCIGEPVLLIAETARTFGADLVIVGHRRQSILERWWSGASGAYLVDQVPCSVLVARPRHPAQTQPGRAGAQAPDRSSRP